MDLSQKDNHSEKGVVTSKENDGIGSWFTEYLPAVANPHSA